jgi:AcrR family transcriptional regulator
VFAERGVQGASIDEITQRAGFTRGAFYSNFDSKAALLIELCEARLYRFADESLPTVVEVPEPDRVGEVARLLIEQGPQPEIALLLELARLRDSTPEVAELLDGFLARFVDLVAQLLADHGAELGGPDAAARTAGARALVAAVLGVGFLQHLGVRADDAAATAELLLDATLRLAFPDAERHRSDHRPADRDRTDHHAERHGTEVSA